MTLKRKLQERIRTINEITSNCGSSKEDIAFVEKLNQFKDTYASALEKEIEKKKNEK